MTIWKRLNRPICPDSTFARILWSIAGVMLLALAVPFVFRHPAKEKPPRPRPEPLRSYLTSLDYEALAITFAQDWLRDKYSRDSIFISSTTDLDSRVAATAYVNNKPWHATVTGKLLSNRRTLPYSVSITFEGMDNHQTVYRVTNWSVRQ